MPTTVYAPRNANWRTSFAALDATGAAVTGLVDGDWTKRMSRDGVGNQSVSGITVSQVDATNNPGEYAVFVPAGRLATAGLYNLRVTRTADPTYTYETELRVTEDGTPTSAPTASFAAATGDGRVMSGASPLVGAAVYLDDGTTVLSAITDAAGLWGPVFLSDGTWSVTAQKSGYAVAGATILVSGGVATGPGSDLSMTANTGATGSIQAASLLDHARRMAFDASGARSDQELYAAVNDALLQVATDDDWQWYLRRGYLSLNAAVAVTVTLTNGSATATTTGSFPAWAADGRMIVDGTVIDIASRASATSITLDTPWTGTTGAVAVTIMRTHYRLPDDLLRFGRIITGQKWGWSLTPASIEQVYEAESAAMFGQLMPDAFAIADNSAVLWPYPTAAASVAYTYFGRPATLVNETDLVDMDLNWMELVHRAIEYQVSIHCGKCVAGSSQECFGRYQDALARSRTSQKRTRTVNGALDQTTGVAPLWRRRQS